ncbi:MAG TPA: porin [Polyangia bacterium]|nr:porin [Polyangia bacterium]
MTVIVAFLAGPAVAQDAPLPPANPDAPAVPADAQPTPTPVPSPDVTALQTRLDALEQRTQALEAERARLLSQPAPAPRTAAAFTADETGFSLTSADRLYQFRLKGQYQVDGRRFFDDAALGASDTFLVRRARPIVAGTLFGLTDFYVAPDFGNNAVTLYDAYLDTHPWPWLRLRVGKFKGPVGLERLQSDSDLVFAERALDSNLSSQREVGIQLWGDIAGGLVHWDLGVFNGNPDNGLNDIDSNHAKTFAGRLFIQPFALEPLRIAGRLGVGIAASTGNEKGSATNPWLNAFKSDGQQTIFQYLAATPANTVFALGRHTRINPQLYYYIGPFGLLAEWVKEYQELANSVGTGAVNNNAAHVTASVVIGGAATYEGIKPNHPLSVANGTFGAFEIGLRYEYMHIDTDAFPTAADPSKSVRQGQAGGIALNWQLTRNIKASGDFVESWFDGGAANKANRTTEKVGIGRFQVYF